MVPSVNTPTKFLSFASYSALQLHKKKERRTITRLQTPTPMGFTKRDPADTPFTGTNLSVSSGRLSRKYMLQTQKSTSWRFVLQTVSQNFLLLTCQMRTQKPWLLHLRMFSTIIYSSNFKGRFS